MRKSRRAAGAGRPGAGKGTDAGRRSSGRQRGPCARQRKHRPPRPAPPRPQCACVGRCSAQSSELGWAGPPLLRHREGAPLLEVSADRCGSCRLERAWEAVRTLSLGLLGPLLPSVAAGTGTTPCYSDIAGRRRLFQGQSHCGQGPRVF